MCLRNWTASVLVLTEADGEAAAQLWAAVLLVVTCYTNYEKYNDNGHGPTDFVLNIEYFRFHYYNVAFRLRLEFHDRSERIKWQSLQKTI